MKPYKTVLMKCEALVKRWQGVGLKNLNLILYSLIVEIQM